MPALLLPIDATSHYSALSVAPNSPMLLLLLSISLPTPHSLLPTDAITLLAPRTTAPYTDATTRALALLLPTDATTSTSAPYHYSLLILLLATRNIAP